MPEILSQPKQNPVAKPVSSLEGTMTTPPIVDVGGGVKIPTDYAALLGQQAQTPTPYEQAPGGTDMLLAALGGLLSGNPGSIFSGIMETRAKAREIEQANMKAMQENAKARTSLMMAGVEARRADEEGVLQKKIDELRLAGKESELKAAEEELKRTKDLRDIQYERDLQRIERANLALEKAQMDADKSGSETAREIVHEATRLMPQVAKQLEVQLRSGEKEPVIRTFNRETGEFEETRGLEAIRAEFENDLVALTTDLAVEDALPLRDSVEEAYNQMIQPLLDQWEERITTGRVEKAKSNREKARAGAEKYKKQAQGGKIKGRTTPRAAFNVPSSPVPFM